MADKHEILAVFEELESTDVRNPHHCKQKECKPKILLSHGLIETVKLQMTSNEILSDLVREALQKTSVGELENMLVWLNACLVNPSLHLAACRDRVWTSYQKNLVANIDDMTAVTNSRQAAAIVALQVMKTLVALNYSEAVPVQSYKDEIGEKEEDILAHIAGYLLRKRGHGEEGQALTSSPSKGLTSLMDRGGLTYAQDAFTSVVREFEIQFRQLPPRSVDFKRFEDSVIEQNVPFRFFQLLDGIDSASESKELFFRDILHLFFTVRAHHKCRHLMEKCAQFAKSTRKALRDSI